MVWEKVKSRQAWVTSAEEFYQVCKDVKGIESIFIPKTEVEKYREFLDNRWKLCKPIPQIQSCHYFCPSTLNKSTIVCGRTKTSEIYQYVCLNDQEDSDESEIDSKLVSGNTRLAFSDVYSDDEYEDVTKINSESEVQKGQYLLIEHEATGKKNLPHKYIVVTQWGVEDNGDIEVFYLSKVASSTKNMDTFKIDTKPYVIKFCEVVGL